MATLPAASPVPLCVDLDGTLARTDLLFEAFFALARQNPLALLLCIVWMLRGRAYLKEQIAKRVTLDASMLPYNTQLLAYLRSERSSGRELYLCTATHGTLAEQVATHIGLFTGVFATRGQLNLRGSNKARVLVEQFGDGGFDYCGDARADIPVWRRARRAIVVGSRHIEAAARKVNATTIFFDDNRHRLPLALKAMRPYQWIKNVLVFVPLLAAHRLADPLALRDACIAFAAFCLCASSVYLLNDMLDLDADRRHVRKCSRPFASGNLPLSWGVVLTVVLATAAGGLTVLLPAPFAAVLAGYFAATLAYSIALKRMALVDVFTLACLYTVRVIAGGAATAIMLSHWLILFCVPIFLSLAMVKRYVELDAILREGKAEAAGRGYITQDMSILRSFGTASAYLAVLVLALYLNSPEQRLLYSHPPALWMLFALTLFWVSRIWMFAFRGRMHDDPIVFAFRDRVSVAVIALCGASMLLAI